MTSLVRFLMTTARYTIIFDIKGIINGRYCYKIFTYAIEIIAGLCHGQGPHLLV